MTLQEHLTSLEACDEAKQWAGERTATEAWQECERLDWMIWWAERTDANTKPDYVRLACAFARSVLHLVPDGDDRPRLAIEATEAWINNPCEETQAEAAASAASAASAARAARAAEAAAAWAAAWAAAGAAAWAAAEAEAAAEAAAARADSTVTPASQCDLIRAILRQPWSEPV